jgi:hypothetical protein
MKLRLFNSSLLAAATAAAMFPSIAAADVPLQGDAIKRLVSGRQVFLSVPLGGEFPLRYANNGVVAGSGEGVGLGRFMQPKDSGRWWVAENKLCQQWKSWYDGKTFCFRINQTGPRTITWVRDDGYAGTARVVD